MNRSLLMIFSVAVVFSAAMAAALPPVSPVDDEKTLAELNAQYIEAFLKADPAWYKEHLTEDFICILGDGSILDKTQFLAQAAKAPDLLNYKLDEVRIRIFGDAALVHGTASYARRDGTTGVSRYTDVYIRTAGAWKVVAAQVTRSSPKK